jgi:basic amino acid/polyamine antiporter, APA family
VSETTRLKEGLSIVDVVSLGVGSAVGVSVFSIMAPAAKVAGSGMLLALALAAIPMVIFAVVYAFMGSTVPKSGASFEWPARFIHPFAGFVVAWLRVIGNTGALTVLTLVLVSYASRAVSLPQKPSMFVLLLLFFVANLVGVKVAAGVERVLVVLKLVAFAIFVAAGVPAVSAANFSPATGGDWRGVLAALPLLVSLYMGIESAVEVGEEIRNSAAVIAKGLAAAVIATIVVYVGVSSVALGVLGAGALGASDAPLFDAGERFLGRWNSPLIIFAAVAAIGTSLNAIYMTFTRFLFAMGRDGVLPEAFARVHPRWQTPHVAVTAVFLLGCAGLLLPTSLVFLFLAVSIPTMLKYLSNCWSAIRLVGRHPELHRRAKFALSAGAVRAWSWAGIVAGLALLVAGMSADWRPYAILAGWFVVGLGYWVVRGRHMSLGMQSLRAGVASGVPGPGLPTREEDDRWASIDVTR